mmetsp:Transcript_9504/g.29406  ORF Transcript_9504/g.29406 Transcript_9504/m.29406 type:complete len:210 (+) Transcript_9504:65-694(+)
MAATIRFNVGGELFEVAQDTIRRRKDTMLNSMLERWTSSDSEPQFIDRDPKLFRYILAWYRDDGRIIVPLTVSKEEMLREAQFFGLPVAADDIQVDVAPLGQVRKRLLEVDDERGKELKQQCRRSLGQAIGLRLAERFVEEMRGKSRATLQWSQLEDWTRAVSWKSEEVKTVLLAELAKSGYTVTAYTTLPKPGLTSDTEAGIIVGFSA